MKQRIIILSAFLSPLRSGAEACAEEVPLALCDQYDFTIVTARMRRSLPKRDMLQGKVPVVRVGLGVKFDKWLFPFLAPLAVRKLKPDIIHAVLETFAGLALVFCNWTSPSAKRMLTLQTTNRSFLKKLIVRSPDCVTAISSVLQQAARQWRNDDIPRIPNGIQLKEITEATKRCTKVSGCILFVGRLEPMKGVDTLLKAFAQISSPKLSLRIVGEGSERSRLEHLSKKLGIADRVTFTGYIPAPQVYDEYAQAEIFCGVSRSEALGNVFLEAQAAGCIVVAAKVGGIPDVVEHEVTGHLVPPDDPHTLANALTFILNSPDLHTRFTQAWQRNAQKYDWSVIALTYAKLYEN
ncbi:MAG: glycosyltransferase family 4 protein [Candidatus Peribacteraceae bacterium]